MDETYRHHDPAAFLQTYLPFVLRIVRPFLRLATRTPLLVD